MQLRQKQQFARKGVLAMRRRPDGRFIYSIPALAGVSRLLGGSPAVRSTVSCQCVAEIPGWTTGPIWCTLPLRTPLAGARHDAAAAILPQPVAPAA